MEEIINKLNELLEDNTKVLVGVLLKRLENLKLSEGQTLTFEQIKSLYSNIVKNSLYENNRFLLKLIRANFETGKIVFRQNTPK